MTGADLLASLEKLFGAKILEKSEFRGELTFRIAAEDLREVAGFCRDDLSFDYLIDITSVDNFGEDPRFEIVYELYSMTLAVHLRLKLRVSEDADAVDTVSDIWATANWHEREIYDMMGLRFNGHPGPATDSDVGRLSVLPAAKGIPARGQSERNAGRRLHLSCAAGRRTVCHSAEHRDGQGSRTARARSARRLAGALSWPGNARVPGAGRSVSPRQNQTKARIMPVTMRASAQAKSMLNQAVFKIVRPSFS